jgi:hypothetical protein
MSNNNQSSIDFILDKIPNSYRSWLNKYIEQAKAMHNEEKLTNYSDGYLEGFNRALDLVELTVEEYKCDIYYDKGLARVNSRIKELRG